MARHREAALQTACASARRIHATARPKNSTPSARRPSASTASRSTMANAAASTSPPDLALPDRNPPAATMRSDSRSPLDGRDGPRRSGARAARFQNSGARRPRHRAFRRPPDLQLRHRPRRGRLAHDAHRSRRRPRLEHAAPDADGVRARLHAAGLRASAAGDGPRRLRSCRKRHGATSVVAYREAGYFPGGGAELPRAAGMVAWRSGNFLEGRADRVFRFRGVRHLRRAFSTPRNCSG